MSRYYVVEQTQVKLSGDTFSVKEPLKALGGRWDSTARCWVLSLKSDTVERITSLGFVSADGMGVVAAVSTETKTNGAVDTASEEKTWQVSEIVAIMTMAVKKTFRESFWVVGEVSSFRNSNGHCYFDIVDSEDQTRDVTGAMRKTTSLSCSLWAGRKSLLEEKHGKIEFADGLKVKVLVHVDVRKEGGRFVLIVDDVDLSVSEGALAAARQNVVRELRKRGLYELNKQKRLSAFPLKLALITAKGSRAETDFIDELTRSLIAFEITLFDAHMQGEHTSNNVSLAFQMISEINLFDVVVVTRGGGSRLDLRWFDDLEISKQIAYCKVPVISAIGHFEDVSVADEVSFRAEKTPTGAARFLVECVSTSFLRIEDAVRHAAKKSTERIEREKILINRLEVLAVSKATNRLNLERSKLENAAKTISLLSKTIDKTIRKGFAVVRDAKSQILKAEDFLEKRLKQFFVELRLSESDKTLRIRAEAVETEVVDSQGL